MSNVKNFEDLSPKMKFFVSKVFPLIFILVGLTLFLIFLPGLLNANDSKSWPTTEGRIIKSEIGSTESDSKNRSRSFPIVHYEFSVNGTSYTGNQIIFGLDQSENATRARNVTKHYPKEANVTVYYMAQKPEMCILEPGIKWQTCLLPGIGMLFIFVGGILALSIKKNKSFTEQRQS